MIWSRFILPSAHRQDNTSLSYILFRTERPGQGDDRPVPGFLVRKIFNETAAARRSSRQKGLLLLVGGMKKEIGMTCSDATAKAFFRTVSVPHHETLSFMGVDAKGAILEHPSAISEAREAGRKLVV